MVGCPPAARHHIRDDGLPMASGGTRQVPTTAMTGGMSSDMLRHVTSSAADGGYA